MGPRIVHKYVNHMCVYVYVCIIYENGKYGKRGKERIGRGQQGQKT